MNKIKLIKSFANYSLWEYVLNINEEEYVMTDDYWSYYIHKDIVEWMKDHFEEVEEPVKELRKRVWYGKAYRRNDYSEPSSRFWFDNITEVDQRHFDMWNYYKTKDAAQSVALLRKHVYKFPMCNEWDKDWVFFLEEDRWSNDCINNTNTYEPLIIHYSSTEEDRVERLRLINEVIKNVWYLTI